MADRPPEGRAAAHRYAVWLLASSKTFDVSLARSLFGPPAVGMEEAIARTVAAARRPVPEAAG